MVSVHGTHFLTEGSHALIVTEPVNTLCRMTYCKCHLRNLPLSTIYRFFCYSCNLVLNKGHEHFMNALYRHIIYRKIILSVFRCRYIDAIYFIINIHFV